MTTSRTRKLSKMPSKGKDKRGYMFMLNPEEQQKHKEETETRKTLKSQSSSLKNTPILQIQPWKHQGSTSLNNITKTEILKIIESFILSLESVKKCYPDILSETITDAEEIAKEYQKIFSCDSSDNLSKRLCIQELHEHGNKIYLYHEKIALKMRVMVNSKTIENLKSKEKKNTTHQQFW